MEKTRVFIFVENEVLLRQAHKRNKHQWAEGQATEVPFIYFNPYQNVRSSFGLHLVDGLLVLQKNTYEYINGQEDF